MSTQLTLNRQKVFLIASAVAMVALVYAQDTYLPPATGRLGGGGGGGGGSRGYGAPQGDEVNEPANYEFSYEVQDPASGNDFGHKESRKGDVANGMYHVLLPDGRTQLVDYVADQDGYKPQVRYEGTAQSDSGYNYKAPGAAGNGGYNY